MRTIAGCTAFLLLAAVAHGVNAQTLPASGPGSSPFDTKATVDYNQSQSSYSIRSTPSMGAPALTTTLSDTCMGSTSFGLSVTGFGATGGTTRVDQDCVRRLDAREFRAMGLTDVALALLCQSESNRRAVEATGHLCPGTTEPLAKVAGAADPAGSLTDADKYRDPIIRSRLGLPDISAGEQKATPSQQQKQPTQPAAPVPAPAVKPAPAVALAAASQNNAASVQAIGAASVPSNNGAPAKAAAETDNSMQAREVAQERLQAAPNVVAGNAAPPKDDAESVERKIKMYGWKSPAKTVKAEPAVGGLVAAAMK